METEKARHLPANVLERVVGGKGGGIQCQSHLQQCCSCNSSSRDLYSSSCSHMRMFSTGLKTQRFENQRTGLQPAIPFSNPVLSFGRIGDKRLSAALLFRSCHSLAFLVYSIFVYQFMSRSFRTIRSITRQFISLSLKQNPKTFAPVVRSINTSSKMSQEFKQANHKLLV